MTSVFTPQGEQRREAKQVKSKQRGYAHHSPLTYCVSTRTNQAAECGAKPKYKQKRCLHNRGCTENDGVGASFDIHVNVNGAEAYKQ